MSEFKINLIQTEPVEFYEKDDGNIIKFSVQLPTGEIVSGKGYRVYMNLSRDAKIGLGIGLIRSALREKDSTGFSHMYPCDKSHVGRDFGIYLHPQSCELLLTDEEFGTLEDLLKKT